MPPTRLRCGRLLPALLLPALLLTAAAAPAAAARPHAAGPADASGLTINAFIWECAAYGSGVPDGVSASSITVKRKDGTTVPLNLASSAGGAWHLQTDCDQVKGTNTLRPGDRIKITLNDASSRTFTIPDIVPYGNPWAGTAGGPIPDGDGTMGVSVLTCDGIDKGDCGAQLASEQPAFNVAAGAWTWTAPPIDLAGTPSTTGLDIIRVAWATPDGQFYQVDQYDSTFIARVGSPVVKGYGRLGKKVTVTLKTAKGATRATGTTTVKGHRGAWSVTLKQDGKKVSPRIGDVVSASIVSGSTLKLRKLQLGIDPDSPSLLGTCWAKRFWSFTDPEVGIPYGGLTDATRAIFIPFLSLPPAGKRFILRCAANRGAIQEMTWTMPAS